MTRKGFGTFRSSLVAMIVAVCVGAAGAANYLQTLKEGTWVCVTPEAYDEAIAEARKSPGKSPEDLRQELLDRKQCIYVDTEFADKIMTPFATVLERQGDKVKVSFTVDLRKRIELLHRQIARYTLVGWTDAANLIDKEIL
jgi:hypothetical protein